MGLVRGSFVRCKEQQREGVVCTTPLKNGFVYVQWLTDKTSERVSSNYYMEYVAEDDIDELPHHTVGSTLIALRLAVLR
jgi:hypothetical protein